MRPPNSNAILAELRRVGLPLPGLGSFLAWTFVCIGLWAVHPAEAFRGLGDTPRFADFFYYAVSTAFISPPGALLTAYASSFVVWGRGREDAG